MSDFDGHGPHAGGPGGDLGGFGDDLEGRLRDLAQSAHPYAPAPGSEIRRRADRRRRQRNLTSGTAAVLLLAGTGVWLGALAGHDGNGGRLPQPPPAASSRLVTTPGPAPSTTAPTPTTPPPATPSATHSPTGSASPGSTPHRSQPTPSSSASSTCPPAPESYPGKLVQITAVTTTGGQVSVSYRAAAWECDIEGHEFYAASGPTRHAIVAPTAPIDAITYAGHGTARHQITAAQLHDWLAKHDFAFFGMKLDSTGTAVALKQLYNA